MSPVSFNLRPGALRARLKSRYEPSSLLPETQPKVQPEPPLSDAAFFARFPDRRFRVRAWDRADWHNPDLRYMPLRVPVCSIIVRTPYGPVARYQPTSVAEAPIIDTDEGAEALIAAAVREAWR